MNKKDLLKQFIPGLLPILVFIIADEYFGTQIAIIVALAVGLIELVYFYIKEHRIEKFVIIDTLLLIIFSGVSLFFDNDKFFKLKPAFMELIMVAILGISAFSTKNLMLIISKRYVKNIEIDRLMSQKMKKNAQLLFYIFLLHSILIIYSVYYMSQQAWAFISTALFYILIAVYFLFGVIKNKFEKRKQG